MGGAEPCVPSLSSSQSHLRSKRAGVSVLHSLLHWRPFVLVVPRRSRVIVLAAFNIRLTKRGKERRMNDRRTSLSTIPIPCSFVSCHMSPLRPTTTRTSSFGLDGSEAYETRCPSGVKSTAVCNDGSESTWSRRLRKFDKLSMMNSKTGWISPGYPSQTRSRKRSDRSPIAYFTRLTLAAITTRLAARLDRTRLGSLHHHDSRLS